MAVYTTINDPGSFFNTVLWTGTGSANAITGVGFTPDNVWIKCRSFAENHCLGDTVRGVNKQLRSDTTEAQSTGTTDLTAFGADGFTLGTGGKVNGSTKTYAAWNWIAGTTTGITGSPSITPSSYSFNATSKFSLIAYTGDGSSGATLPHGLGVAPNMIITKDLDATEEWAVYTSTTGATKFLNLDSANAAVIDSSKWNDTEPDATVFSLGNDGQVNRNTEDYIAYCFANVAGYSRYGYYIGNGNANGPFIYTGFRPAFIMCKDTEDAERWTIMDSVRTPGNIDGAAQLFPDVAVVESDSTTRDLMWYSNGFKPHASGGEVNFSGKTYVYAAFAEAPFVNSEGVPCNAR